jgi:hypothetical protein
MPEKKKKTPYQRIMHAVRLGYGLRLTPEEVSQLASDDAISKRAEMDDENDAGVPDGELT